jgi:hypothetical protein
MYHPLKEAKGGTMKRVRGVAIFVLVGAFVTGFSIAALATASSNERRFFGPTLVNGAYECATQQAYVHTNPPAFDGASEFTDRYNGQNCGTIHNAPAGYLGARVLLIRASNGTICADSGWRYNSSSQVNFNAIVYLPASCPHGASYYAHGRSAYYNANTGSYVTSAWIDSPNQNL